MAYTPKIPKQIPMPFCDSGNKRPIPLDPTSNILASLSLGFPPLTREPKKQGGVGPSCLDVNGILNWLSEFCAYIQSGGLFSWNAGLNYAPPAITVGSDKKRYMCIAENGAGVDGVGVKDPTSAGAFEWWKKLPDQASVARGMIKHFPFISTNLPSGWYFCDGATYALTSAQGQALDGLSSNYKLDWNINVTTVETARFINTPNLFATDGTGATFTPADGTNILPGSRIEDTGRRMSGSVGAYFFTNWQGGTGCIALNGGNKSHTSGTGWANAGLEIDAIRNWSATHTGARFKVYGVGMTPAIFLGV